jgi:ferredoxin-NADP reductase
VVPLMAMLRLARRTGRSDLVKLIVSARSPDDLYYASELPGPETHVIYTRTNPPGVTRPAGRLSAADLPDALDPAAVSYVCGSDGFANTATDLLIAAGIRASSIRVERFGPSG